MKARLTYAQVFSLPKRTKGLIVYYDASQVGLGGVRMRHGKVVAYDCTQLKVQERNHQTRDLDLAAVVFALKLWRHYLY